jgi:hypothetical protein
MKRALFLTVVAGVFSQGCNGDDAATGISFDGGSTDATLADSSSPDSNLPAQDSSTDGGCPASWTIAPVTQPTIAVPDGGGGVLLHASGSGTQNYECTATAVDAGTPDAGEDAAADDAGVLDAAPTETYAWTFVGPQATLSDCNATLIGHHFASEAGASEPEWQTTDGTYVIGKKIDSLTIDGGNAIPWLLLEALSHGGGTGTLSEVSFVQRLNTTGGLAPSTACNSSNLGTVVMVPYTADYYFFGTP